MSRGNRLFWLALGPALLALTVTACGGDPENSDKNDPSEKVTALNLSTLAEQEFDSADKVPDSGWVICRGDCIIPPYLTCQMLDPLGCIVHKDCRLRLRCEFDLPDGDPYPWYGGVDEGVTSDSSDAGTASGSDGAAPYPGDYDIPGGCSLTCVPKGKLSCDEITDSRRCGAREDCEWGPGFCPLPLDPDQPRDTEAGSASSDATDAGAPCTPEWCPPIPPCPNVCRPKPEPQTCQDLDRYSCERRPDCQWMPAPCPMCEMPVKACEGSADAEKCATDLIWPPDCRCPASCQPRPICPDIEIPMRLCKEGTRPVPIYDDSGCLIGYECRPLPCKPVPVPECANPVPIYENGCIVGYKCLPPSDCDALQEEYKATLQQAKTCGRYAGQTDDGTQKDADILPREECTTTLAGGLGCMGCPTFVNPANAEAIKRLTEIQRLWNQTCMKDIACPAIACLAPEGASCVDGLCQDDAVRW